MAVKDVKAYYFKMLEQYVEMKNDLADFEEALKNGFITEDQMQAAVEEVQKIQLNYERLTYIMYLLELPRKEAKKVRHNNSNKKVLRAFKDRKADQEAVELENKCALEAFRKELKQLENNNKNK